MELRPAVTILLECIVQPNMAGNAEGRQLEVDLQQAPRADESI